MILRTYHQTSSGVNLTLFMTGVGLGLLFLILSVGPKEGQCHCIGVLCISTSEEENVTYSKGASSKHVRQVRPDDNVHNEASNNASLNVKYMEGERNDRPRPKLNSDVQASHEHMPTSLGPPPSSTVDSNSQPNVTMGHNGGFAKSLYNLNTAALLRGFYVFGGLGAMVVMYILVRTIRLRRKKTTVRRYGILANREDLEMTPLGADDDEDTTIFEMSPHSRT